MKLPFHFSRKPYVADWQWGFVRRQIGKDRDKIIGLYLPYCILWFRRKNLESLVWLLPMCRGPGPGSHLPSADMFYSPNAIPRR